MSAEERHVLVITVPAGEYTMEEAVSLAQYVTESFRNTPPGEPVVLVVEDTMTVQHTTGLVDAVAVQVDV